MLNVLFSTRQEAWGEYHELLSSAFASAGLDVVLATDHAPETVDYVVYAPNGGLQDFTAFARCKGVLSLWAGVETIIDNPTLTQPVARMVDDSLTQGMVEWVIGHVLRHHLGMDAHILVQDGTWQPHFPPLAKTRAVTILGLGALGLACGQALVTLGFQVRGWSRNAKTDANITCFHGPDGLKDALRDADMVVGLLPDTPATTNILNAETLALLKRGSFVINPGRGPLIDDDALIAALDDGQITHATLDVFRIEPLPVDHPFWAHPNVTVTPHIASTTRPDTASRIIAENIARNEAGHGLANLVDRSAGY